MSNLFAELKRRNIFRVAGVYAVVGWILAQIAALAANSFGAPDWVMKMIIVVLGIGFPVAMLLAWAFEMTPEGVKRSENVEDGDSITDKTGRRLDYTIIVGLVLVAALVVGSRFMPQKMTAPDVTEVSEVVAHSETEEPTEITDEKISIAVLPFEDFSSDKDQDYFAKGISEELLNVLARIDGLRVSSRTSSFAFKERNASTGEIAEALNVKHILEGSIRKSGATLRITAQLIDTSNDEHMWSETYDRPLTAENIFAIQDEISAAIVAELKGKLSLGATQGTDRTASLEAYELYMQAREQMQLRLPDTLEAAVKGYKQVITIDPEFAPAYAGLAVTYLLMQEYTGLDFDEAIELARPNVERALVLAPNSAEAITAAASLSNEQANYQKTLDLTKKAIAVNPNYVLAYHRQGAAYGSLAQPEKALASYQKALELDPLSAVLLSNEGSSLKRLGHLAAARATHEKNIKYNPNSVYGYKNLGDMKLEIGDYSGAHSLFKDVQAINPEYETALSAIQKIYLDVGLFDQATALSQTPRRQANLLVGRGELAAAQKIITEYPDETSYTSFLLGNNAAAYPGMRNMADRIGFVSTPVNPRFAKFTVATALIFREKSDPDAQILFDKFNAYYAGKTPADFTNENTLFGVGLLAIANGKPVQALPWFERMADLGYAWAGIEHVNFEGMEELRQYPQWLETEKRLDANAAKHRALIEAQLANPKPNWINLNE